jgi:hypothetical protein
VSTLRLTRIASSSKNGTFGVLAIDNEPQCVTLEPYWRNNEYENSCVSTGIYKLKWVDSPKYDRTLELVDVQGRSHILFHWGNRAKDTEGCILVGEKYGQISCQQAILYSLQAFKSLLFVLQDETEMTLIISEAY